MLTIGWSILRAALSRFFVDNGLFLASALAFNLLLYFVPLSLLMISLLGYTVLDSEQAVQEVLAVLKAFLPRSQEALAENLATVVADRGLLGFVGFISFLLFSTFLFGSIRTTLNRIFQVKEPRTFVRGIGIDVLMMGLSVLLLLLVAGTTWFLTVAEAIAHRYPSWSSLTEPTLIGLGKMIGVAVTILLFYTLYGFSPAATISTPALLVSSITGTILFQSAKWGFAWYVVTAQGTIELYGVLGGVLFFFIWLYYASVVFVLGAEVGIAYDRH